MTIKLKYLISFFLIMAPFQKNFSSVCQNWSTPQVIGQLDHTVINESSGIALSAQFKNRLYHINDSGDGPFFYQSQLDGRQTKKITIQDFTPIDVEDLAYGDCPEGKCLIIADIGDNPSTRKTVKLAIIPEVKDFPDKVKARFITVKYPKRAHNVEGVALHPNGNIYILTKEVDSENNRALPAEIFMLKSSQWKKDQTEVQTVTHVGTLDFPYLLYDYNLWGRIVTGLDISADGSKLLVLTYRVAMEINLDLGRSSFPNSRNFRKGVHYSLIELNKMPQQEAISYLSDGSSFIFTTEYKKNLGLAPIQKVTCQGVP